MNCTNCNACGSMEDIPPNGRKTQELFHYSIPPTLVDAGLTSVFNIQTYSDSYMIVKKLMSVSTGSYTVRAINGATGRVLQSAAVNHVNMFGVTPAALPTYNLPAILKDAIILPPSSNLQLTVVDTSGAPNTIQMVLAGWRWFDLSKPPVMGKPGSRLEWYQQVFDGTVTPGGRLDSQIRIDADADFLIRKIVRTTADTFKLQIADSSSKDQWFDTAQMDANCAGSASFPYWLPKSRLVKANGAISLSLENVGGAGGAVQVVFEGAKVYRS